MVIKSVELEKVVGVTTKSLPELSLPQVAFAGRSNVGKSSLINTLLNRRSLARVSSTPGKTQTINFYNINNSFYFTDLPGYGYAKVSMDFKAQWGPMIERYLNTSQGLKAVFLLIDGRRTPSGDDFVMFDWIVKSSLKPVIIMTKCDKLKSLEFQKARAALKNAFNTELSMEIIPFSALKKTGRDEVWSLIENLIEEKEENEDDKG